MCAVRLDSYDTSVFHNSYTFLRIGTAQKNELTNKESGDLIWKSIKKNINTEEIKNNLQANIQNISTLPKESKAEMKLTLDPNINYVLARESDLQTIENRLMELQEANIRKARAYLYEVLETNFIESRYKFCNYFYDNIDIEKYKIPLLVSLLTISSRWRKVLVSRNIFYSKVEEYIKSSVTEEEAASILEGFEI